MDCLFQCVWDLQGDSSVGLGSKAVGPIDEGIDTVVWEMALGVIYSGVMVGCLAPLTSHGGGPPSGLGTRKDGDDVRLLLWI